MLCRWVLANISGEIKHALRMNNVPWSSKENSYMMSVPSKTMNRRPSQFRKRMFLLGLLMSALGIVILLATSNAPDPLIFKDPATDPWAAVFCVGLITSAVGLIISFFLAS